MTDQLLAEELLYPSADTPLVFADGIANFNNSHQVAKFYLYRHDPSTVGRGATKPQVSAQVVMPMIQFFQSVAFLMRAIEVLCEQNPEHRAVWDEAKKFQDQTFSFNG